MILLKRENNTMQIFLFQFIYYDLLYLAIFSNNYDIVKVLLQKGYKFTPLFFRHDPWGLIGRNHSIKIIKLLLSVTDFSTNNLISSLINANFFNAIPLIGDILSIELKDIEKYCLNFKSISNSITEEKALTILENLLLEIPKNYNKNERKAI